MRPSLAAGAWCALLLLAAALLFGAAPVRAETAEVTQLRVDRTDDGLLLSGALRFELPTVIDDALTKGIPMFFVAEATLQRERWYWYDRQVAQTVRHMRLSYQPLTRRWRLQMSAAPIGASGLSLGQNFDSREEALAAVQRLSNWKIADAADLEPDSRHVVQFRFRLDVSQLPRPFQIGAVGQSEWQISVSRNLRVPGEPNR